MSRNTQPKTRANWEPPCPAELRNTGVYRDIFSISLPAGLVSGLRWLHHIRGINVSAELLPILRRWVEGRIEIEVKQLESAVPNSKSAWTPVIKEANAP